MKARNLSAFNADAMRTTADELSMLRAISLCEELARDQARTEPIDGIIALAAKQYRVDANELCTTWTAKLSAAATARAALPTRHRNAPQPKGKTMSKTIIPSWTEASETALSEVATIIESACKAADLIKAKPGSAAAVKALAALVAARQALEK